MSINDPATMVLMNGRPKSRKGCFWSAFLYLAATELGRVARKDFEVKGPGILQVSGGAALGFGDRAQWARRSAEAHGI